VNQAIFALVAFLDESALSSRNPVFADWARLPLQTELFHHHDAGEIFFQELNATLARDDSTQTADMLEVYYLCLLLGFKGRYSAGGDLRSIMAGIQEKIRRVRAPSRALSPQGGVPAEAVRLVQSDPWIRNIALGAVASSLVALVAFLIFKFMLTSGASELATSAVRFGK
jgi:type VI secretion system protein ImpK